MNHDTLLPPAIAAMATMPLLPPATMHALLLGRSRHPQREVPHHHQDAAIVHGASAPLHLPHTVQRALEAHHAKAAPLPLPPQQLRRAWSRRHGRAKPTLIRL